MFELRRSLRRIKPHRFTQQVRRRPSMELPFVPMSPAPGQDLLLDTCVYIDVMKGDTPPEVDALLTLRTSNHLAICVAELTVKVVAVVAPKIAAVAPVNPVPLMVTVVPPDPGPEVGEIDVTVGAAT